MHPNGRLGALVAVLMAASCGGGHAPPSADVPADAPEVGSLRFRLGPSALASWDFGQVAVGARSVALLLTLENVGADVTGVVAVRLEGSDGAEFDTSDAATVCDDDVVLAPGASCAILVRFRPSKVGTSIGHLVATTGMDPATTLFLRGNGLAGPDAGVPDASPDAGVDASADADAAVDAAVDAPVDAALPCDMTGTWIAEHHTTSTLVLGGDVRTTSYHYLQVRQAGDRFTVEDQLNCGFVVRGFMTMTLSDPTLEALAAREFAGLGRQGTFASTSDGQCAFSLERSYDVRGANKAQHLTDVWRIGDPPKPLSEFPRLPSAPPEMEDWDEDGRDGISVRTTMGQRYVAQRAWNEQSGVVPAFADQLGGQGRITVRWDAQEALSPQTSPVLRIGMTPKGDGWARYARVDRSAVVVDTGDHPVLETCRNVQRLARETWPSP